MRIVIAVFVLLVLFSGTPAAIAQAITLVTLGDSLTEGAGDDGSGGYPARLLLMLETDHPGSTLNNLAVSGFTSDELINEELAPAVTALNAAPPGNLKVALIWIGSNDLFGLYEWLCDSFNPPNDYPGCEGEVFAAYSSNITTILDDLEGAGAEVLIALLDDQSKRPVMSEPDLRFSSFPTISATDVEHMSTQVSRYNAEIADQARDLGMTTVDFFNTTIFETWNTLSEDGNHPNAAGYDAIAAIWFDALNGTSTTTRRLTVTRTGAGSGTVVSSPSGIDCGSICSHDFTTNTTVTLSAVPTSGSTFSGWSGACAGNGDCTLTMANNQSVSASFDGGTALDYVAVVPVVIHAPGAAGTNWRSSVVALNTSASTASLELRLVTAAQTWTETATIPSGSSQEWDDIVVGLFDMASTASIAGSLHIASDQFLYLTSRTFNQGDDGTYGQYLPALTAVDGLTGSDRGYLLNLKGLGFRSNVGFVNLGGGACTVRVSLFEAGGQSLGNPVDIFVASGEWVQKTDVFAIASAQPRDLAYASITIVSGNGSIWAFASVIDSETGDATTIPVLRE